MNDELPRIEFAFPGALRDRLIAVIESGRKTATSSLLREYDLAGDPLPFTGYRGVVMDSNGQEKFIIETTAIEVVRLDEVSLAHALAEGENYASVAEWRAGHMRFWSSDAMRAELGSDFELGDDSMVVLERFRVVR